MMKFRRLVRKPLFFLMSTLAVMLTNVNYAANNWMQDNTIADNIPITGQDASEDNNNVNRDVNDLKIIESAGTIRAVTVYRNGTALVSRHVQIHPEPGTIGLRILDLPHGIIADSFGISIPDTIAVTQTIMESIPNLSEYNSNKQHLEDEISKIQAALDEQEISQIVLKREQALYDAIADRTANVTALGIDKLDLDEITRVAGYLSTQHRELEKQKYEIEKVIQPLNARLDNLYMQLDTLETDGPEYKSAAQVTLFITEPLTEPVTVIVSYLVNGVAWAPAYNLRTDSAQTRVLVELDAMIMQHSGEDWTNASVQVSTGTPILPTRPPRLQTTSIDVISSSNSSVINDDYNQSNRADLSVMDIPSMLTDNFQQFDNSGNDGGLNVPTLTSINYSDVDNTLLAEYTIPGQTTIHTNDKFPIRLSVSAWWAQVQFQHVAAPLVSQYAFIRGTITNNTRVHWPPGEATVYMGNDYSGLYSMPHLRPGEQLDVFFGYDRRISVRRLVVNKRIKTTGLLADGRETVVDYRIDVSNTTGLTVNLEIWDRIPYSKDDNIKVSVSGLSDDLSSNSEYLQQYRPLGLLRWDKNITPGTPSNNNHVIEYTLTVSHRKDLRTTSWPD